MSTELALLSILAAVTLLLIVAQLARIPYPILLVLGGLGLAVTPGIPEVELDPELVLLIILPPLLYAAAFFTPLRELRRNVRAISLLAIGLVLATMVAVAAVAHEALGFGWAEAFVLGAIVSPTDPVAATAIARRLGVPGRIVTIVEGESLVNDATALVAYKFAVAAVVTGSFSLLDASGEFVLTAIGGIAVGIASRRDHRDDPAAARQPAGRGHDRALLRLLRLPARRGDRRLRRARRGHRRHLHGSTHLAADDADHPDPGQRGLGDRHLPAQLGAVRARRPAAADRDRRDLRASPPASSSATALLIAATVIVTRIVWVFPFTYLPRLLSAAVRRREPYPPWRHTLLVAWTGMRGAVSLAAALALPLTIDAGGSFPDARPDHLLRLLRDPRHPAAPGPDPAAADQAARGRRLRRRARAGGDRAPACSATEAAMSRMDELAAEDWVLDDTVDRVRGAYRYRQRRFTALSRDGEFDGGVDGDGIDYETRSVAYQRLVRELLEAQRATLIDLRDSGEINDDVLRRIERELDLEDSRLEI